MRREEKGRQIDKYVSGGRNKRRDEEEEGEKGMAEEKQQRREKIGGQRWESWKNECPKM